LLVEMNFCWLKFTKTSFNKFIKCSISTLDDQCTDQYG